MWWPVAWVWIVVIGVGLLGSLAMEILQYKERQAAERAKWAFIRLQQRQAERQVQQIARDAFAAMVAEASKHHLPGKPPCEG